VDGKILFGLGKPLEHLLAFGECRNSPQNYPTDKLFTGQRLDDSGLYFYNARYYDATIGRFISADPIVPDTMTPQAFNRYSYVVNNPLKYTDPTGLFSPEQLIEWFGNWLCGYWEDNNQDLWEALLAGTFGDMGILAQLGMSDSGFAKFKLDPSNQAGQLMIEDWNGEIWNVGTFFSHYLDEGWDITTHGDPDFLFKTVNGYDPNDQLRGEIPEFYIDLNISLYLVTFGIQWSPKEGKLNGYGGFYFGTPSVSLNVAPGQRLPIEGAYHGGQGSFGPFGGQFVYGEGNYSYEIGLTFGLPGGGYSIIRTTRLID